MNITKKRHLEIAIEDIPKFESPKINLEQYPTSAPIVADLIWNANSLGDISNKNIFDLGCGTGLFAISSLLIGAKSATGFDVDPSAIKIAKNTVKEMNMDNANFFVKDIYDIDSNFIDSKLDFDTVITNPPFGAQSRAKKGIDRAFMELAMKSGDIIYSFHMSETENFVKNYYKNLGGEITHKLQYKFPLLNTYEFHTLETRDIDVTAFRVVKLSNG